jgi:hypothetical protein
VLNVTVAVLRICINADDKWIYMSFDRKARKRLGRMLLRLRRWSCARSPEQGGRYGGVEGRYARILTRVSIKPEPR